MTAGALLRRPVTGGVLTVEVDNGPLNLVDGAFVGALTALVAELQADESVRVVIFRSRNAGYFVNHFDMSGATTVAEPLFRLYDRLAALPQVAIGEIAGRTRGAGSEFALALDMRFAARETALFGQPEVLVGLHPGAGGTQRLSQLMGRGRALEVMLGGADFDAATAERYGWVNRALPQAELTGFVDALAGRIAAAPPQGVSAIKGMTRAFLPDGAQLAEESALFRAAMQTDVFRERLAWAFKSGAQQPGSFEDGLGEALTRFPG